MITLPSLMSWTTPPLFPPETFMDTEIATAVGWPDTVKRISALEREPFLEEADRTLEFAPPVPVVVNARKFPPQPVPVYEALT